MWKRGQQRRELWSLRTQLLLSKAPWMKLSECKDIMKGSVLESWSTHSLEWIQEHSSGYNQWWQLLCPLGQWLYHQCGDCRFCWGSFPRCWSFEQSGWWQDGYKWLQRIILPTLGLHYCKGSGRRGERLWWRPIGHSHARFNCLWVLSAGYSGHTHH